MAGIRKGTITEENLASILAQLNISLSTLRDALLGKATSFTTSNVTVGNTSTLVLAANADRKVASFVNDSDETIYLSRGNAAELHKGIRLNANGGSFEISGVNLYTGNIYAICESGGKVLCVEEGV